MASHAAVLPELRRRVSPRRRRLLAIGGCDTRKNGGAKIFLPANP